MHRFFAAVSFAMLLCPAVCHAALHVPQPHEIESWLRNRAQSHKGLADKVLGVRDSYEVVFVPGILGSQLRIGSYTYGEDPISADKLVFDPTLPVQAATLNRFKAKALVFSKKVDIYGSGLDLLMAALGGKPAFEFSYDWRNDIDVLADRLQQELESKLKQNTRVLIVAHSMGGLVSWHWKNKYPRTANKVKLVGLVLLGSPLQGTCEPARMLVEGYGAADGAGSFDKVATKLVFGDAQPAIFTFPSVYQLLPRFDRDNPCIRMQSGAGTPGLDHHQPQTWLGRPGGAYNGARKFHSATGLTEDEYSRRVQRAVDAGRRFRESFNLSQQGVQTFLLYSKAAKLQSHYLLKPDNDWLEIVPRPRELDGDGRVPASSAQNEKYFDLSSGAYWKLSREHGELLSDGDFSDFVQTTLQRFIGRMQEVEILAYAVEEPALRSEIEALGWIVDPTVRSWLIDVPEIRGAQTTLAAFAAAAASGGPQATLAEAAKSKAREFEPANTLTGPTAGNAVAATLYKSALVLDPESMDARSLNRLGLIQIRQGRYMEAATVLSKASRVAKNSNDRYLTEDVHRKIDVNLGFALQKAAGR